MTAAQQYRDKFLVFLKQTSVLEYLSIGIP